MKAIDLTAEEQTHVRTALRFLRARCGGWMPVAKVLRISDKALRSIVNSHATVSPTIAFRVARLAKVGVDDVLAGHFPPPGTCPYCGHCQSTASDAGAPV